VTIEKLSYEHFYDQYKVLVYNVALHYLQNSEDAEEVTQDVFVQAFQSLNNFEHKSTLKTWIYRITINKSIDYIKHKNSQKRFFIFGKKTTNTAEINSLSNFDHPGILMEQNENAAILFSIINQLPQNQKTAFILSKLDGLSNPEISEVMNLSISAIESLVFRAKQNLKEKLSKK
jgi:RNA polymerase sigma factor (sigma-70 family)